MIAGSRNPDSDSLTEQMSVLLFSNAGLVGAVPCLSRTNNVLGCSHDPSQPVR